MPGTSSKPSLFPPMGRERERKFTDAGRAQDEPRATGKAKLDRQAVLLLAVNALFTCGNALSATFVNIYIWKIKHDYALLGWFAVVHQLAMSLTFWLAGKWVKEGNKMNALRGGVIAAAAFYGLVLAFGTRAADAVPVLGLVQGVSSGLFWLSFNVVYFEITGPDNRDRFNGWAGLLGSLAGMLAPWLSGLLIASSGGNAGYRLIFGISLAIFVAGAAITFGLHKREPSGRYDWRIGLGGLLRKGNPWRAIAGAMVAQGLREGIFGFVIALLVYTSTGSEMKLGSFSLYTSAAAFLSFWVAGRLLKPRLRFWGMLIGAAMMTLFIVPLLGGDGLFRAAYFRFGHRHFRAALLHPFRVGRLRSDRGKRSGRQAARGTGHPSRAGAERRAFHRSHDVYRLRLRQRRSRAHPRAPARVRQLSAAGLGAAPQASKTRGDHGGKKRALRDERCGGAFTLQASNVFSEQSGCTALFIQVQYQLILVYIQFQGKRVNERDEPAWIPFYAKKD
ncbi:MFS transporter [Cohnella rhizosphaerae]|uniref:MFS transporter n=1 Tax=Cohnella rhizosphaerae TaxID=1457232 RepID=A0A9X4KVA5_9BACL|nr:MFS transporter [Cohnella rhizosphaerae]MDG0811755.1 MFS transporter [Cohnella rhizosphaerae]